MLLPVLFGGAFAATALVLRMICAETVLPQKACLNEWRDHSMHVSSQDPSELARGGGRRSFWPWAPRSEAAGALLRRVSFATWVRLRAFRASPAVRVASSVRRGVFWLGPALVGSSFCRGPAHGLGPCVAGSPATWAERRPCTGPGARPRRRRRVQPLALAALTRDREPP